jgi:hypothetical protein
MPDLEAVRKILEELAPRGHCLHLRGLPFAATADDVEAFLSPIPLAAPGAGAVVFTFTADGRPTGEAYVEVVDEAAAAAAMLKHKDRMGARYIEVFASTKHDLLQAAQAAQYQASQAALRRRWAALGLGGAGGPGAAFGVAAPAGYGRVPGQVVVAQVGPPAAVSADELAQAFQGEQATRCPAPQRRACTQTHHVQPARAHAAWRRQGTS